MFELQVFEYLQLYSQWATVLIIIVNIESGEIVGVAIYITHNRKI